MTTAREPESEGRFAVRTARGLVTAFNDEPLRTYEEAEHVAEKIREVLGETAEVERLLWQSA